MEEQGMIERVARAIWGANHGIEWDLADRPDQLDCIAAARAAIKEMRVPTAAMREAYTLEDNVGFCPVDHDLVWEVGIDAALNEQEKG